MNLKDKLNQLKNKLLGMKIEETNTNTRTTVKPELTEEEKRMLIDVLKFKEGYVSPIAQTMANHFNNTENINLDDKVDEFIDWFTENMVKGQYTDIGEYRFPIEMRNFIEKNGNLV